MCAGAGLLAAMVVVELKVANPLVEVRLLRNRLFAAATSLYCLGSVAYLGALYLAALFLPVAFTIREADAAPTMMPGSRPGATTARTVDRAHQEQSLEH